jgi:hypothetical protein
VEFIDCTTPGTPLTWAVVEDGKVTNMVSASQRFVDENPEFTKSYVLVPPGIVVESGHTFDGKTFAPGAQETQ